MAYSLRNMNVLVLTGESEPNEGSANGGKQKTL